MRCLIHTKFGNFCLPLRLKSHSVGREKSSNNKTTVRLQHARTPERHIRNVYMICDDMLVNSADRSTSADLILLLLNYHHVVR